MDEQQTKRYRVVSPLLSDGDHYGIDDAIDLPPDRGDDLVKLEVLAPAEPSNENVLSTVATDEGALPAGISLFGLAQLTDEAAPPAEPTDEAAPPAEPTDKDTPPKPKKGKATA